MRARAILGIVVSFSPQACHTFPLVGTLVILGSSSSWPSPALTAALSASASFSFLSSSSIPLTLPRLLFVGLPSTLLLLPPSSEAIFMSRLPCVTVSTMSRGSSPALILLSVSVASSSGSDLSSSNSTSRSWCLRFVWATSVSLYWHGLSRDAHSLH